MTAHRPADPAAEPPIAHHYVFVLVGEAVVLALLAWLAASFR
jgi:hypothetical protein